MKRMWWKHGLKFALFAVVAVGAVGFVVMSLWNWLLPGLFGLKTIDFWQALGLFVLSKLLLGGFRGKGHHHHHGGPGRWRERMAHRWDEMSEEERQRFREGMGRHCGWGRDRHRRGDSPEQAPVNQDA